VGWLRGDLDAIEFEGKRDRGGDEKDFGKGFSEKIRVGN